MFKNKKIIRLLIGYLLIVLKDKELSLFLKFMKSWKMLVYLSYVPDPFSFSLIYYSM